MTTELGARRAGVVLDKEALGHAKPLRIRLHAHHVGYGAYAGDQGSDIIDLHIHIGRIGRSGLEICGALVIDTDEMHPRIGSIDRVVALLVGLATRDLLHPLVERDQHDRISSGRCVGRAIGDGAGDRRGRSGDGEHRAVGDSKELRNRSARHNVQSHTHLSLAAQRIASGM